jgi:hypothetical protein
MVTNLGPLTSETFAWYAMNNYDNPQCTDIEEFYEDLNRFKYVKRLIGRYLSQGDLQERLILNHITILYNVFGIDAAYKMLQYKCDNPEFWPILKPFLVFLHVLPESELVNISPDLVVVNRLREV